MTRPQTRHDVVSSEDETLILVNGDDVEVGTASKADCHDGDGVLHRAFSLFVFNDDGALLLQQRQADKRLWPLFWSNSCCSHPRAGEAMHTAVARRLEQELGLRATLGFVYKFEYVAHFRDVGTEHELCWVYAGTTRGEPLINSSEIANWRWVAAAALDAELAATPEIFTPWFKLEWQALCRAHPVELCRLVPQLELPAR
jgi:isopentenyl-diphosphate Delta-isomerase